MKTYIIILSAILLLSSCNNGADEIETDNRVHAKIHVFQMDTITRTYNPLVNGKVYFYYGVDPSFYYYESNGVLSLDGSTVHPDTMLSTDGLGEIDTYLSGKYRNKLSTFLIEEENLIHTRVVSLNYILPNHKDFTSTIYMIDESIY